MFSKRIHLVEPSPESLIFRLLLTAFRVAKKKQQKIVLSRGSVEIWFVCFELINDKNVLIASFNALTFRLSEIVVDREEVLTIMLDS